MIKIKLIGGYPGLCLCLLFCLGQVSCGIKHQLKPVVYVAPKQGDTNFGDVDIRLIPDANDYEYLPDGKFFLMAAYGAKLEETTVSPKIWVLNFRFYDIGNINRLQEQLLATGLVTSIRIAKR